jgi:hypothetical protein
MGEDLMRALLTWLGFHVHDWSPYGEPFIQQIQLPDLDSSLDGLFVGEPMYRNALVQEKTCACGAVKRRIV